MIVAAFVILSVAAALFAWRLLTGPSAPDRVIALDGILACVLGGILVGAADRESTIAVVAVLLVALVGFIATGVLARFIEKRGG